MATRQIYRGNPESKQYTLFNNFSGGINTTTVDELVMTNEFRHLENVELIEQGKIQKRKGFAPYELLNTWLEEKGVSTLAIEEEVTINLYDFVNQQDNFVEVINTYNVNENYYTKLLYDSSNIFIKIREYDTLEDFFTAYNNVTYNAIILLVTKTNKQSEFTISGDFVTFSYLRFYNIPDTNGASHQAEHVLLSNIFLGNNSFGLKKTKKAPITGLNTVTFEDKVYINLHDIIESIESTDIQYAVVSTPYNDDNILNILPTVKLVSHTNNNYEPTPYEVSFVGFNIFSQQPLTFISQDTTGLEEVRGLFITDIIDSSIVYSKIPESGQFKLHIITKGTLPSLPIIRLYTEDSLFEQIDLDTELTLFSNQNSLLVYDVKTRIENNRQIFIEVKRQEQANLNFEKSFSTTADMINWYKNTNKTFLTLYSGQDIYSYYEPLASKTYNYQIKLLPAYLTHVSAKTAVTLPAVDIYFESNYPVLRTSSPLQTSKDFINQNVHVLFRVFNSASLGVPPVKYIIGVGGFDNTGKFKTSTFDWNDYFQTTTNFPYIELNTNTFVENFSLQILNIDKISRVGSPPYTFYRWNGGEAGTIADFTVLPDDEVLVDIYNFTNFYNIGIEQNPRKVEGITFKDKSMIVFQNRLLIYSDNTIIISDPYKFNYFPNYNFITLALDTDDKIQKIAYFRGNHMILTKKRIYRMSGTFGQNDFAIVLVNDSIGCVAPDSVRGMNNNLIFLGEDGLYHIKQSFYQEGLENVDKVDKNILGLIPYGENYESFLYNEQYMLLIKDINGSYVKTIKQYYNMEYARKAFPYVVDTYKITPVYSATLGIDIISMHLATLGIDMVSIKDGVFYLYDEGYTDFGQTYQMIIETPNYMLGYPTHDKKFKNMFIKSKSTVKHPVYITVYLEDNEVISPYEWVTNTDGIEGEITYLKKDIDSLTSGGTTYIVGGSKNEVTSTDNVGDIDYESETTITSIIDENLKFNIGQDYLGGKETIIHKFVLSQKGKYIAFKITQDYNGPIAFQDFGILFKLGKVKEG